MSLSSYAPKNPVVRKAGLLYLGVVGACALYGALQGACHWYRWRKTRKYRKISYPKVEAVVNAGCDAGVFVANVGSSALACASVAATAPVSVPALLYYHEDTDQKDSTATTNTSSED